VSLREYGWYLGSFGCLVVAGVFIAVFGATLFASLTPLYISLVFSVAAIALAVVAWRRYPKSEPD
jgi:membrane protein implicated in regulation of membrane protease activity